MQVLEPGITLENCQHRARITRMAVPHVIDGFHPRMPGELGERRRRPRPDLDHARFDLPRHQRPRRVLGQDAPPIDDREPIAQPLRLLHVVRGKQHRGPALLELAQARPDEVADLGVEAGRWLVEDEQFGVVDQGPRDHEPPPHAARQRLDPIAGSVREGDKVEERREIWPQRLAGRARKVARVDQQVLHHGEVGIEVVVLGDHSGAGPHLAPRGRHRLAEHGELAAAWRGMTKDHAKRGGLAGAVGPEQPEAPALGHPQIDAIDDRFGAEALAKPPRIDHVCIQCRHPRAAPARAPRCCAPWQDLFAFTSRSAGAKSIPFGGIAARSLAGNYL